MSADKTTGAVAALKRLAIEAAREAPNPRAKRCWAWHDWTMWALEMPLRYEQSRRCLRCGKTQMRGVLP